ncbi:hypothetical protein E9993_19435 [Labilibacter sediminis]|nr:hypothetical protein E9993_19435 [Labilibacter sediminis]
MEKRLRRIEILVFITLALVVINSMLFIVGSINLNKEETAELIETKELPSEVTRDFLDDIVYNVKTEFNRSNWEGFYNIFGEYSKAQLSVDDIVQGFEKLKSATRKINTYTYSHYLYEGNNENAEWYEIHYKCRFDNGKGTIKISTRTVEKETEVVGIVINLNEL